MPAADYIHGMSIYEHFRNLLMRVPLYCEQVEYRSEPARKLTYDFHQLFSRQLVYCRTVDILNGRLVYSFNTFRIFKQVGSTDVIQCDIYYDSPYPAFERTAPVIAADISKNLYETVLKQVHGRIPVVAAIAHAYGHHFSGVCIVQRFLRFRLTPLATVNQFLLLFGHLYRRQYKNPAAIRQTVFVV